MGQDLAKLYAPYQIPTEIVELFKLEAELKKDELSLEMIGLRPIYEPYAYSITPVDCIPFAETGGDGIHFAFLTEFGKVNSLEEAPIICISPTNDPPIRLVAKNIRDFFDLVSSVPYAELLESIWDFNDEVKLNELIEEMEQDTPTDWKERRHAILNRVKQTFSAKEKQVVTYMKEILDKREKETVISTLDNLGIIGTLNPQASKQKFQFEHPLNQARLNSMKQFLHNANTVERLAFIRDANYYYVVAPGFDEDILHLISDLLVGLNLSAERERLNWRI
ncbi:hypothetical protein [Ureibacillus manganicus]|uniref:Uncharacterized protein n=1 Tax=Ureibacillus manganicus DSM 26584 TaxID=1384049 RepID=A0A0A3I9F3_9BACL|nr:hypothetical protein [Ureibacillus manganicus]KGR79413.1 hypothetical protein CD29_06890 [Ureibacillus manganicus DSM 26584]